MSYRPNADAAEYLIDRILPLVKRRIPSACVRIVGPDPPRSLRIRAAPDVELTGWVPDVTPHYQQAAALAVPLLAGGGTRLKVLEAMQQRVPVISTTIGCEGLNVRHGESVLIAETAGSFADALVRIWREPDVAERLVRTAAALVRSQYDWDLIGRALEPVLAEIVARHAERLRDEERGVAESRGLAVSRSAERA